VGRDKGSLTEQQTKGTGTTTVQIRRKHNTNRTTQRAVLLDQTAAVPSRAVNEFPLRRSPHRNPAWQHMVWNTLLCLSRRGQHTRLCPFLDSLPGFRWILTLSWLNPGHHASIWMWRQFTLDNDHMFFISSVFVLIEKTLKLPGAYQMPFAALIAW